MRNKLPSKTIFSLLLALGAAFAGCSEEPQQQLAGCPAGDEIRGACAGVPAQALCDGDSCTEGVECTQVIDVDSDGALKDAASGAGAGTCIALAPGSYGEVSLPGGARLLGRSAADVTVAGISLGAGEGSLVRGLSVGAKGLSVGQGASAELESILVDGSASAGLTAANDAVVTLRRATIRAGAGTGVVAGDGASVTVEDSILEGNAGPGLTAQCSQECDCASPPDVVLRRTLVRDNHVAGVLLYGAHALLESVDIEGTLVGDDVQYGIGGGGLTAAACSDLTARDLHVFNNQDYGVLIDDSAGMLGDPMSPPAIEVHDNHIGVWAQHISRSRPQTVTLDGVAVRDNSGVGIGTSGETVGLIICRSAVENTKMALSIVEGGGEQQVGDGLLWLEGSEIAVDGLTLSGNARASVVIDGEATGTLANVTLSGGDESKGVVQQKYSGGGAQPSTGQNAPAITTSAEGLFAIPVPPELPPKALP